MNDLIAIRRKDSPNSPKKIKEILLQISNLHFESDKILQKLEDNGTRYNEILKEVSILNEELENEKQKLESKMLESKEHNHILQNLKEDKENLDLSLRELETKYKTLKKTKPSLHDEQLLESGKRKHKLYKEFTGIRWNYSTSETLIEGFITNKKNFIENISYKGDIEYKTLRELLWATIHRSTMGPMSTEDFKENKPVNN